VNQNELSMTEPNIFTWSCQPTAWCLRTCFPEVGLVRPIHCI